MCYHSVMARKITPKQKKFADAYLESGNGTLAVMESYDVPQDKPNLAAVIASENLTKPNVINYLEAALPDDLLARIHKEGLEATRLEDDGPDFNVRHKYLDTAYKLKGSYAAEKSINMNVSAKDLEATIIADIARFRAKKAE